MLGLLGGLANIDMEAITKQVLEFKGEIEARVREINETQTRIEQKLDEVLATTRIKGD